MLKRDGNVLSPKLRQAWDSGTLRVLTKNDPAVASGAHISMIAHVSSEELRRELDSSSAANGFGNRFVWICVRRSKSLPDGGCLQHSELDPVIEQLRGAVDFGRRADELRRNAAARSLWHSCYEGLSEGRLGLYGSLTARAEAQVMRLACVYALLDRSAVVDEPHLRAALALWRYADGSVRFLFGDALGHPLADGLLRVLRSKADAGLSRTEIRDALGRHEKQDAIAGALNLLAERGLARTEAVKTGGRPEERWFAIR
jgi:hypothetical protein